MMAKISKSSILAANNGFERNKKLN